MDLNTGIISSVTTEQADVIQARTDAKDIEAPALMAKGTAKRLHAMAPERRRHIGANIRRQRAKRKARNRRRRKLSR